MDTEIRYYATNEFLGLSPERCDEFRAWALKELNDEFVDSDIIVSSEKSPCLRNWTVDTDSLELEQSIDYFCFELFERRLWETGKTVVSTIEQGEIALKLVRKMAEKQRKVKK